MPQRLVLLYNREAGQGRGGDPAWLADTGVYLRARGWRVEITAAGSPEAATDAARRASQSRAHLVIAAGGDEALRAVADGLAGTGTPLGILPRGTVNVLARTLGIPLADPLAACDVCLSGETRRLDLGRVRRGGEPRHFLLMCSVGFDAQSVANVNPDLKGVVGAPAYLLSGLATLATYQPTDVTLTLDGVRRASSAFMVVVANTPSYGGDFRIAPLAAPDDGVLDLCVFEAPPGLPPVQRAAFLRQIGAVALNRHLQDPDISCFRARHIEIAASPPAAFQIDGDAFGETPVTIDVAPAALSVRVPR